MSDPEDAPAPRGEPDPEIQTVLFVRELWSGPSLIAPLMSTDLASAGVEGDALVEQQLFLREYLARSSPEVVARYSFPAGTTLVEVTLPLPREELPRRLQIDIPIAFACAVIPWGKDRWVTIPAIAHTFYLEEDEGLEEAIRAEVRRIVFAQELSPYQLIRLLPAREHRLERIAVPLPRIERSVGRAVSLRKAIIEREIRKRAVETLLSVATPLHIEERDHPPPVGRDAELTLMGSLLGGEERLSVLLVGQEQAGKTALLEAWIDRGRAAGRSPLVYSTSGAQLIAGMGGPGQWQERIRRVLEAAGALDAILYFEHLEDLLAERTTGGIDLAGAIKAYLDEGKVRVVAEIREGHLDALEGLHWGFFGCLSKVRVGPLSPAQTLEALHARARRDEQNPTRARIDPAALPALVDLAERYLPYRAFPGKAFRLYDELCSTREKTQAFHGSQAGPRGTRRPDRASGRTGPAPPGKASRGSQPEIVTEAPISVDELYDVFSLKTGVPSFLLRDDRALTVGEVADALRKHVVGQDEAVRRLAETIGVVKAGLQPAGKPLATFLFVGPTGVGKTELARSIAAYLFGSADRLLRFDMSEFTDAFAAERLIRGTDRDDGLLTRKIREQPFCVLLLDEIEKAHPAVFDLLLQVSGEGRLSDARGRVAHFQNAIIIMTSNLGAAHRQGSFGFTAGQSPAVSLASHYQKHVEAAFRPEFVNRLDRIIAFNSLSPEEVFAVTRLGVARIRRRRGLEDLGAALEVDERAMRRLAEDGYSEHYGARALRRHLEEHLASPLARLLASLGAEARDLTIHVTTRADAGAQGHGSGEPERHEPEERRGAIVAELETAALRFEASRRPSSKGSRELQGSERIAQARRDVDAFIELSGVQQIKEQVDFLVTQLGDAAHNKGDRRIALEIAELQGEHHRLSELWSRAERAQADVHDTEEVALAALFEGEEVRPFLAEALEAREKLHAVLPYLLVALEPQRDEITLMIQELDDHRAFDYWLAPLLHDLAAREWTAVIHVDGGARLPGDEWPADRRWGPPRTPEWTITALNTQERPFKNLLLRCKGPYAGVMLALEAGLHRMTGVSPREAAARAHLYVHPITMQMAVDPRLWKEKIMVPPPPSRSAELTRGPAARELDGPSGSVQIAGRRAQTVLASASAYWSSFERVALAHLLLFETQEGLDRDTVFAPRWSTA